MNDIEQKELKALEEFMLDIDCLNDLSPWIYELNIFKILKLTDTEIRHSNFLAWLLNPNESHSFGNKILKELICYVIRKNKSNIEIKFNLFDAMLWDYQVVNVYREKNNMDILIVLENEKLVICIENKTFSSEYTKKGKSQTEIYKNKIDELYPDANYKKLFIFLTPDGEEAKDKEHWIALSYDELIDILQKIYNNTNNNMNIEEKIFIKNYISGVKTRIMEDIDLQLICKKIYFKHKTALDLIIKNRPDTQDLQDLIVEALIEKLEKESESQKIYIDKEKNKFKGKVLFNTQNSFDFFPKLAESKKSSWGTDFMFCYEINLRGKNPLILATMNNNNLSENELEICKNVWEKVKNDLLQDEWQWRTLDKRAITKINLDELTDEEFEENKENFINRIFIEAMNFIDVFEKKL